MLVGRSPFVTGWDLVAIRCFCELCNGVVGSDSLQMFACMEAPLKIYALLVSV